MDFKREKKISRSYYTFMFKYLDPIPYGFISSISNKCIYIKCRYINLRDIIFKKYLNR